MASKRNIVKVEKIKYSEWEVDEYDYEYFTCQNCGNSVYNNADTRNEAKRMLKDGQCLPCCPYCRAIMENSDTNPELLHIFEVEL